MPWLCMDLKWPGRSVKACLRGGSLHMDRERSFGSGSGVFSDISNDYTKAHKRCRRHCMDELSGFDVSQ